MPTKPVLIILALFIAEMSATFEAAMLYAALPRMISDFGDTAKAGWLVTAHLLVSAAAALVAGRLGDIYGRLRIIIALLIAAAVGSAISAISTSFGPLLFGRALQGLVAAVLPLTIGVIRESLPASRVPVAIGLIISSTAVGTSTGLVIGGMIVDHLNWHWMFVVSGILLALSTLLVWLWVPSHPGTPPSAPVDWVEGLLPVPAITALMLAASLSKELGWTDRRILGLLTIGIIALILWIRRSLATKEPFIDLRLLAHRDVAIAVAVSILVGFGTMQTVLVFSTMMQAPTWTLVGLGLSATVAGFAKIPSNIVALGAGPFSGWLSQKRNHRSAMVTGSAFITCGWLMAMSLPQSLTLLMAVICFISFGTTMLTAAVPNVIVQAVPNHRTGEAIGMMSVIRGLAFAIGSQFVLLILATHTLPAPDGHGHFPSAQSFLLVMGWMVGLSSAAIALSLLLPGRGGKSQVSAPVTDTENCAACHRPN